jgi:[ribosomal protein S18]-alanine N-acetyltransferase
VGYVCAGPDARVAGQEPDADLDDLGWGFRPDLTGRCLASTWLPAILALLADELTAPRQRVVVVAWNERSQAVARRLGFGGSIPHAGGGVEWVVMTRQRPGGAQ